MKNLVLAVIVVALAVAFTRGALDVASAAEQAPAVADDYTASDLQTDEVAGDDDVVDVQVWTLVAVGAAAAVLLLALLLRIAMGWVKPPPPQEDSPH
ncbi:MAG: hypothetical protein IH866_06715 [Chloroflexi bacterium]|nr:hypothetical protein [Chloroflexota bacterium]